MSWHKQMPLHHTQQFLKVYLNGLGHENVEAAEAEDREDVGAVDHEEVLAHADHRGNAVHLRKTSS